MTAMPFPAEVPLSELPGEQLRARVARAQVYLIYCNAAPPSDGALPEQAARDHLAYLYRLEQAGRLYGYGPVEARDGDSMREMAIVAAASREEAERIAAADPLHKAGLRSNVVRGHTMNEGVACYVGRTLAKRAEQMGEGFDPDISGVKLSYAELTARAHDAAALPHRSRPN